jgi:5'-3' exonuclease, N-terminal resolvase-like domain
MMNEIDILVDFDPIVYACGFVSQSTRYVCVAEDETGALREAHFVGDENETANEKMKVWKAALPEGTNVIDKSRIIIPEPLDHCLYIVRRHLDGIYHAVSELPVCRSRNLSLRGFLSGPDNYRQALAKQAVYKGNRDPENRPFHYDAIREYIRKYWDTVVSRNCEADDLISIVAEQSRTQLRDVIVVSIDKDLDQIPGQHYNPDKKVFYHQDRDSSLLYFYQQCLSGDPTDNIPGCWKVGKVGAEKFISEYTAEFEGIDLAAEQSLWGAIVDRYAQSVRYSGCPYGVLDAESVAIETGRLVYIQRAPRELWNPPGTEFGIIPDGDADAE